MVAKLEDFKFGRRTGGSTYPWDEWTDGSIYRAKRGEDFDCSLVSFQTSLHQQAARQTKDRQVRVRCQTSQETKGEGETLEEYMTFRFSEDKEAELPTFARPDYVAPKPKKKKKKKDT